MAEGIQLSSIPPQQKPGSLSAACNKHICKIQRVEVETQGTLGDVCVAIHLPERKKILGHLHDCDQDYEI